MSPTTRLHICFDANFFSCADMEDEKKRTSWTMNQIHNLLRAVIENHELYLVSCSHCNDNKLIPKYADEVQLLDIALILHRGPYKNSTLHNR